MVDIHLCRVRKLAAATWAFGPGLNNEGHRIHRSSSNVRPRVRQSVGHALIHFISFIHSFIRSCMYLHIHLSAMRTIYNYVASVSICTCEKYIYIYIYIYIYMYVCMYVYIYTYVHIFFR